MDKICSEKCLLNIALLQFDWKSLGLQLLNAEQDVKDIDREEKEEQHKREKVLLKWKEQQGSSATYRKLIDTLMKVGNKDTAERVELLAVDEMLDAVCSGDHLLEMSSWEFDWKSIIESEQHKTESDHAEDNEQQKRKEVLTKWNEQQGSGATYRKLIDTIKQIGSTDTANKVHRLATTGNAELALKLDMVRTNCGCGNCDFKKLISNGCPTPRRKPFMYLDTSSLTQKEKDMLLLKLEDDMKALFKQWDMVVYQFRRWMKDNFSLDECKEILSTVPGKASEMKEVPIFTDRVQEIVAAKSYLECFVILSHYYSWFDCSILETVATSSIKDSSEFLSSLRSYTDQLHNYCKRNIFECPAPSLMSSTKGITFLVLKLTGDQWSNAKMVTAEKIQRFKAELMKTFETPNYALNLCTVGNGCVELVYSIPLCIYNELFPLNEDQCKSLPMLGVMEVITKDYHYKKEHSTLQLQQPLPSKMIGTDEKHEEAHDIQEDSPSVQHEAGIEKKECTQIETPSTEVKQTSTVPGHKDTISSSHDLIKSKDFFSEDIYKLLVDDVKIRDSIAHYICEDEANWMSLIEHVGLEMNVHQLKESSPGDILLTTLKEWNAHMKAMTVRRFCDVCNELGILEVEQYMKKVEQRMDEGKQGVEVKQSEKEVEQGMELMKLGGKVKQGGEVMEQGGKEVEQGGKEEEQVGKEVELGVKEMKLKLPSKDVGMRY